MLSLLTALQHGDAAFPSGGFAFSNGIEGIAALGRPLDREALADLVGAVLRHRWTPFERVALARAHRAAEDFQALIALDGEVEAAGIVEPLRTGSRRNAAALLAAHVRIGTPGADILLLAIREKRLVGHLPIVQACLWRAAGLGEAEALAVSAYGTASGLVTAAVRLGRIGAVDAQKVLTRIMPLAAEAAARPVGADERLASMSPLMEIAAMRHARAELKLFAN